MKYIKNSKPNTQIFTFPVEGIAIEATTREEALAILNQNRKDLEKAKEIKEFDLNSDGKLDSKDFQKAGKTLNKAKKYK